MSSAVFLTVVLGVIAGNVAMMGLVVRTLGDRIGDLATRMGRAEGRIDVLIDGVAAIGSRIDRAEALADERDRVYLAKFDAIARLMNE